MCRNGQNIGTKFLYSLNKMECKIKFRDGGHKKQWVCTCPPGYNFHSRRLDQTQNNVIPWNGCGPHEWGNSVFIMNSFLVPEVLQPCCNAHDLCYSTMYHGNNGVTKLSEFRKEYKEFNHLDWGVCDDVLQTCNEGKVKVIPWYNIPRKAWVMFAGTIISSAVIEKSADNFQKLDAKGNTVWTAEWCVKKKEESGLCIYK